MNNIQKVSALLLELDLTDNDVLEIIEIANNLPTMEEVDKIVNSIAALPPMSDEQKRKFYDQPLFEIGKLISMHDRTRSPIL